MTTFKSKSVSVTISPNSVCWCENERTWKWWQGWRWTQEWDCWSLRQELESYMLCLYSQESEAKNCSPKKKGKNSRKLIKTKQINQSFVSKNSTNPMRLRRQILEMTGNFNKGSDAVLLDKNQTQILTNERWFFYINDLMIKRRMRE